MIKDYLCTPQELRDALSDPPSQEDVEHCIAVALRCDEPADCLEILSRALVLPRSR